GGYACHPGQISARPAGGTRLTAADAPDHTPQMSTPGTSIAFPLRSERLLVRPFEEADAPAAHAVYGDAEVMRFVGDGRPASLRETAEMIEGYRRHQRERGFAFWAVLAADDGQLIGDAGLEVTAHGVELGYTLGRPWWGRGLATEA